MAYTSFSTVYLWINFSLGQCISIFCKDDEREANELLVEMAALLKVVERKKKILTRYATSPIEAVTRGQATRALSVAGTFLEI